VGRSLVLQWRSFGRRRGHASLGDDSWVASRGSSMTAFVVLSAKDAILLRLMGAIQNGRYSDPVPPQKSKL